MIDKNGKLFGKISIIDLFVILAIVGLILGTIYKFTSSKTDVGTEDSLITYTLKIHGVSEHTVKYYQEEGLLCFDKKMSPTNPIGTIIKAWSEPYKEVADTNSGIVERKEVPGRITIYIEVETQGLETDTGYFAGGTYELKAGSEVFLVTKYADAIATVEKINSVEKMD